MTDDLVATPPSLRLAAVLVALEGTALVVLAVLAASNLAEDRLEVSLSVAVFFAAYGAALVAGAWALRQGRPWSRGPVLLTQLLLLGIAWNVRHEPGLAVPLAALAVLTLGAMLHPATVEALLGRPEEG